MIALVLRSRCSRITGLKSSQPMPPPESTVQLLRMVMGPQVSWASKVGTLKAAGSSSMLDYAWREFSQTDGLRLCGLYMQPTQDLLGSCPYRGTRLTTRLLMGSGRWKAGLARCFCVSRLQGEPGSEGPVRRCHGRLGDVGLPS